VTAPAASRPVRLRLDASGAVQGVGFRPFVYRLARELELAGWVANDPRGACMEVEGDAAAVERFLDRLPAELPPVACLHDLQWRTLEPLGDTEFRIVESEAAGARSAVVLPDLATCSACLAEVLDPADRRHGYPFTNCTDCGPRYSIIRTLPYDRPGTTMAGFRMCEACAREYADPLDRRFHAQPNACPACGPRLALLGRAGGPLAWDGEALTLAAHALQLGRVVAAKGLGGFHLLVDAQSDAAVSLLRERKRRPHKPFALMVRDLEQARALCEVDAAAEALLTSAAAPIVLLPRRPDAGVAAGVAPENPALGLMLAATPLHHLLLCATGHPLVATSGNLSEEPICTDEQEALSRLDGIADLFLVHDRPIERALDDSVAWVVAGAPRLVRRARGYAPLPVRSAHPLPQILGVGAHLKSTLALSAGRQLFVSQHLGDLEAPETQDAFERAAADLLRLYEAAPAAVAHDLHPDYASTRWALESAAVPREVPRIPVQHHHAHLAACLLENGSPGPALGVVWDGTGYGTDGTIWGGEFLAGDAAGYERVASLHPFRLPGGDAAAREPRRVALSLLRSALGERALENAGLAPVAASEAVERRLIGSMLDRGVRSPWTSSMGRLFDGVAATLALRQTSSFEGEAAMALEFAADPAERGAYEIPLIEPAAPGDPARLDWRPMLREMLEERGRGTTVGVISGRFHNALVRALVALAIRAGLERVALTGGSFQNRLLTERASEALSRAGFQVLLHRQVPPNDGGISLGQVAIAAARLTESPQATGEVPCVSACRER
jgi:hydrogenase maturation protein HypF